MSKETLQVRTGRRIEMVDLTDQVQDLVRLSGVEEGVCVVYCPHTTAGLAINENADPSVCSDLERAFEALVPGVRFDHMEGNSPAHLLSSLTGSSLHLLIESSHVQLGRWQGIFFCEFDGPRQRTVWVRLQSA